MNPPTPQVKLSVIAEAARAQRAKGRYCVPIQHGKKGPFEKGWQKLRISDEEIPTRFAKNKANLGVLLGAPSGGLIDCDLDCAEAVAFAKDFLPPTGEIFGRLSKRASHWIYRVPGMSSSKFQTKTLGMLVELRSTGQQTVIPPSTHPSGEAITYDHDGEAGTPAATDLYAAAAALAAASLLAKVWPASGSRLRNETALALAGTLLQLGWPPERAEHFIRLVVTYAGDEEADARVSAVAGTRRKLDAGERVTGLGKLEELLGADVSKPLGQWLRVQRDVARAAAVTRALPVMVRGGDPMDALMGHLVSLRRTGADEEELYTAGLAFNEQHCVPPLLEAEVRGVVQHVATYPPMPKEIEEVNRTFAVVPIGNKVRILCEHDDDLDFFASSDFGLLLRNRDVLEVTRKGGIKFTPLANYWLAHPQRREYSKLVFEPGGLRTKAAYNLWRRWGVVPRPGDCSRFLAHLHDNICAGNDEHYRWVLAWFAQLFQHPGDKPGTALVLRGRMGTGKTIVGDIFGKLIGRSYRKVAHARRVTGQFNAHLGDCLLLHCDEAFFAGDKTDQGALKDLVTSDTQWIERKGLDQFEAPNHIRLFVTSNAEWVVPAGREERRFAVLDVSDAHMQDHAYFGAMLRQMEAGGYEALLDYLLHLPIDDIDLRTVPTTAALTDQKIATLTAEQSWLLDILENGYLPGSYLPHDSVVVKETLYNHFVVQTEKIGIHHKSGQTMLGKFLFKQLPGIWRCQSNGGPAYEFPPLKVCREAFGRAMKHYDWEKPFEWRCDPATLKPDKAAM